MANIAPPQSLNQQPNNYNPAPVNAFRQPSSTMTSRTTAQGRNVPQRHDERAMSMTSYSFDRDHNQTMSGRVIPNRRRESDQESLLGDQSPPERYNENSPDADGRRPSDGSVSRTMSMASTIVPSERSDSMLSHRPSMAKSGSQTSQGTALQASKKSPLVYPALLSRVATAFRERITVGERHKDELSYQNAFSGAEAVDLISYIIRTTDRNLALLLGRALDAQKFLHDVTYSHRLRDSSNELFQLKDSLQDDEISTGVNGVFTLLSECYSPTCTRDHLCYSIGCPRRLEQHARLNLKPQPGLRREESKASLHEDESDEQKLWINTVSKDVADSVDDREKKRQEVICEIMYTERDFVKDLEYLRDYWVKPLRGHDRLKPSPIPDHRKEKFVRTVFSNYDHVLQVNSKFAEALTRRQQESPVVWNIGDIFLTHVAKFDPFIRYGANQLYGKTEFEKEKGNNPAFLRFVEETERMKESRKLELNGYLTKPTTRLARYPLLLENVQKYTADDNQDKKDIPEAIRQIKEILTRVNAESGKAENHLSLVNLNNSLKFSPGEYMDLKLTEEGRQLVFKGSLKKQPGDNSDILVHLFDHAVLLTRAKTVSKREEMRVYRKPIPLELLVIAQMDEVIPKVGIAKRPSSSLIPGAKAATPGTGAGKEGYPITFKHLGKKGYEQTLYAPNPITRKKWMEHIERQQSKIRNRSNSLYTKAILCDNYFVSGNRVNCLVPIGELALSYQLNFC